jgi:hypothetical protein
MNDGVPAHYTITVTELLNKMSSVQWMGLETQHTGQLDLQTSIHVISASGSDEEPGLYSNLHNKGIALAVDSRCMPSCSGNA